MKKLLPLSAITLFVACSSPSGPSQEAAPSVSVAPGADGTVSSKQITIERIRLRRALGADFVTSLTNGQVIDVPINTNLDIWAEIRRLETDTARLVVNWGNGNSDFSNCGQCRLENVYKEKGRYTVTISVIDLKAPTSASIITALTVTLNVVDPNEMAEVVGLSCSGVSADVESYSTGLRSLLATPGVNIIGNSFSRVFNESFPFTLTSGRIYRPTGPMTIEFASDKNFASVAFHHTNLLPPANPIEYVAYNAAGQPVLTGNKTGAIVSVPFTIEDTLTISGATFRKIVITPPPVYNLVIFFDNLQAGCR